MCRFIGIFLAVAFSHTAAESSTRDTFGCTTRFIVSNEKKYFVTPGNKTDSPPRICAMEFTSEQNTLIRLEVTFRRSDKNMECEREYLHIGNYRRHFNAHVVTSYVFCEVCASDEIVSRGNFLWAVYHSMNGGVPSFLNISYQAFPREVNCNESMFRCSPIQCIPTNQVCDGTPQCMNGQDEYCDNATEGCFRCSNGQCIKPKPTRYSEKWGQTLWYLCDGHRHCDDGTDERKDICFRIRRKSDALIQCIPASGNTTQMMWDKHECDGKKDCRNGEDEAAIRCSVITEESSYDVLPVVIVILSVLSLFTGSALIYIISKHRDKVSSRSESGDSSHTWSDLSLNNNVKCHSKHCPQKPRRPSTTAPLFQDPVLHDQTLL